MDEAEGQDVSGLRLREVRLRDVVLRECELDDVRVVGAVLRDVEVDGLVTRLVVNGVDVMPLVEAELDRRHPERTLLRAHVADDLGDGWDHLRTAWSATHERIRALPPGMVEERVDGEWSALETLRHLVMVHDVWFAGPVRGATAHAHPFGLPADGMDTLPAGLDPEARPSLSDVLNVRQQQLDDVERFLDQADDAALGRPVTAPPHAPGAAGTVLDCLHVLLNEEWEHRRFCERDLDRLRPDADADR